VVTVVLSTGAAAAILHWIKPGPEKPVLVLDTIAFCITLGALAVAVIHARELDRITGALSNKLLGPFPEHLESIADYIAGARKTVWILADCADYGSFRPTAHRELLQAHVSALARNVSINLLIWGPPQAMSRCNRFHYKEQQAGPEFAELVRHFMVALRGDTYFVDACKYFLSRCASYYPMLKKVSGETIETHLRETSPLDRDLLRTVQLCFHHKVMERLARHDANIFCDPDPALKPDIIFWIIDGREALFALPSKWQDAPLFYSEDRFVVQALRGAFLQKMEAFERAAKRRKFIAELLPDIHMLEF
jgi:hypothetical protein